MKEIVLYSSGIDSHITWEYTGRQQTLYVNMGHKYCEQEIEKVKELIPTTIIYNLNLKQFEKLDAEIPLRNMYLAMVAANLGYDKIWLTVQKDETSIPDRTPGFFLKASELLTQLLGRQIQLQTPFWCMDKVEMVRWYVENGKDINTLLKTWACYHPKTISEYVGGAELNLKNTYSEHCANCPACFRRFVAFKLNGISEPWHEKIYTSEIAKVYKEKAEKTLYSGTRSSYILKALER